MVNYYAVAVGLNIGVFTTWDECKKNVENISTAIYKKFDNEEDANNFIAEYKDTLYVYTDGACFNNGSKNAKAGIGIYFSKDNDNNVSRELVGEDLTNNIAELSAAIEAINMIKKMDVKKKVIVTDSEYVIKCATTYGAKLAAKNWEFKKDKIPPNVELVKRLFELTTKYNIQYKHVMAHTTNKDRHSVGNYYADKLANESISGAEGKLPHIKQKRPDTDLSKVIFLNVPFAEKDKAKAKGAKWNPEKKKWYILEDNENKNDLIKKYYAAI